MAKKPNDIVAVLYGSYVEYRKCPGWCKRHHTHLTKKQIQTKGCLGKGCKHLDKILTHPWWAEREQKKLKKKRSKLCLKKRR